MSGPTLSAEHIAKRYGDNHILTDVSFSITSTSISGMIGPNGAGKTTLFSILTGFQESNGGRVRFNEHDITSLSPMDRVQRGMARTFQVPREFGSLTVLENMKAAAPKQSGEMLYKVFFGNRGIAQEEKRITEKSKNLLDFLKLGHMANKSASILSGGQRKLLELGRALMLEPRMILLDEPFAGVNPVLIDEISEMIKTLSKQGVGFLIVEHNLSALSQLVKTLLVLDRGELLAQGEPSIILSNPAVQEAYMGGSI